MQTLDRPPLRDDRRPRRLVRLEDAPAREPGRDPQPSPRTTSPLDVFVTIVVCLVLVLIGTPWVLGFFSGWVTPVITDALASLSFYTHFNNISRGVIDLRDVVFFALLISAMLYANTIILSLTKTD